MAIKEGSSDLVVSRGKIKNLGTVAGDELPWYESIDLLFMDHAVISPTWPFNEARISNINPNTLYEYTYGESRDVFKIKTGNYVGGLYSTTGLCIRGAEPDAYVEIPGRIGKRIVNIYLRAGGQNTSCGNPFIATAEPETDGKLNMLQTDGTFTWMALGTDNGKIDAWWSRKQYGMQKRWSDFDTDGGKNYRIYFSSGGDSMRILNLLIQYKDL